MLNLSPAHWFEEKQAAEDYRDQYLEGWDDMIERFHGPGYRQGAPGAGPSDPENHAFEWCSLMVPQMTAASPRARVRTARAGAARRGAIASQFALNRWIQLVNMKATNEKLATDFGLKYAVAAVFPRPMPGLRDSNEPATWPSMRRISPRRFLHDPLAQDFEDQRWRAHLVIEDKQDLIDRAKANPREGWNVQEIKDLPDGIGVNEARNGPEQPAGAGETLDRKEIAYIVFWVPEHQPDPKKGPNQGYNGALLTLGIGSAYGTGTKDQAVWLRKPVPYFGPRWGPYQSAGAYIVPDDATPLSPVTATVAQADHLNAIARSIQSSIEDYKRLALVSNGDPDLETIVAEGQHGFVYTTNVDDLSRNVVQLELGGLTQQFLAAEERARQSLDRNTGLPDAMRGNVEGGATATEVNAAMAGGGLRVAHHMNKFRDFLTRSLRTVAWYLEFDNTIQPFVLGPEAAAAMQNELGEPMEEVWMSPGLAPGQGYDDFDELDYEIDLYSMERTTEQQQVAMAQELDFLVMQVAPMMSNPQMQHIRFEEYLAMRGELRGISNYGRLFDMEVARGIAQALAQMGDVRPQGTASVPQPRMGADMAGGRRTNSGINGLNHREPKSTLPSRDLARGSGGPGLGQTK